MTKDRAAEVRELGEWDWWYTGTPRCAVLHAADVTYDPGFDVGGDGITACGRRLRLWIPGLFSRMGLPRCIRCCDARGYPRGSGSPKNDNACRPLVEARLKAARLSAWTAAPPQ
jgi:hypothetical protein